MGIVAAGVARSRSHALAWCVRLVERNQGEWVKELKEAVKHHLIERGWTVEDLTPVKDECPMYHRVGFAVGAKIAEKEFEKALIFCGSGMGIHVAASKVPGVHAAVCESVDSARRSTTANNCNVMAMGAFFTGPRLAMAMADAFLDHHFGQGYEDWDGFDAYHQLGYDEIGRAHV